MIDPVMDARRGGWPPPSHSRNEAYVASFCELAGRQCSQQAGRTSGPGLLRSIGKLPQSGYVVKQLMPLDKLRLHSMPGCGTALKLNLTQLPSSRWESAGCSVDCIGLFDRLGCKAVHC
jgi:hypothetical protein